jgi:hypothetical protein
VEAPLTDHKKATNVFILIAKERGIFEQGRYYLSAETLIDMKTWVTRLKSALKNLNTAGPEEKREGILKTEAPDKRSPLARKEIPEPIYASIKNESIHRSNSMSTLPSLCREEGGMPWLNRSMEVDPVYGLAGVEHNLTYSYSSSDDSLNESFSINFSPKPPRSAEASLARPVSVSKLKPEITLQPKPGGSYSQPAFRHSSPAKAVDSSDYLQRMYADMDRIDRQLEMVAQVESEKEKATIATFDEDDHENSDSVMVDSFEDTEHSAVTAQESDLKIKKIEDMMTDLNRQSEELQSMFRKISSERISNSPAKQSLTKSVDPYSMLEPIMSSLARYQATMTELETHARKVMSEIQSTHQRVVKSLAESEAAKLSFLQLKGQAEQILEKLKVSGGAQGQVQGSGQVPVYAQVRKGRQKGHGALPPTRNSVAVCDSDGVRGRRQYQLRPRSLMFSKTEESKGQSQ